MKFMGKSILVVVAVVAIGMMAGCDQAKETLEMTNLGGAAEITKLIGSATSALAGITDIDSAKAALPALKNVDTDLGKIVQKFGEMSPEQKDQITGIVTKAMPQLEDAIAKAAAMPGIGAVVGPTLDSLKNKFSNFI